MSGVRSRLVASLPASVVAAIVAGLFVSGCDTSVGGPSELDRGVAPQHQVVQSPGTIAGVWSGVVTNATDLNNASFGRDPSEWIGREVRGTFAIHLATPGVGDRNPDPNVWEFGPVPGPGPFIEFVTVTALIDDQAFRTSSVGYDPIFFGDVVGIVDNSAQSAFNPQDSFVGAGFQGIGRGIIGFGTFFAPGGVSFDGTTLTIDPSLLQFGLGVIDDLLGDGVTTYRQGAISFSVTTVSVSRLGTLLQAVIELAALGALTADQVDGLLGKLDGVAEKLDGGNTRAACNQLRAFSNQVRAFINNGSLTSITGQPLLDEAQALATGIGC